MGKGMVPGPDEAHTRSAKVFQHARNIVAVAVIKSAHHKHRDLHP